MTPGEINTTAPGRSRRTALALAATVASAGLVIALMITRWGIGTSPDSVQYIKAARQLAGEGGFGSEDPQLIQHAPLYPLCLAVGSLLGVDPLQGARWLNAVVFALNILLVGWIVHRSSRHVPWLGLAGAILMLGSTPMLSAHSAALSEPVFLLLLLSGFLLLGVYFEGNSRAWLLGAGSVVGLASIARYAGAACIITGLISILLLSGGSRLRRIRDALLFGAVSGFPMLAWMLRNLTVASTATNRELFFHPVGWSHAWQAVYTTSAWMLIPNSAPDIIRVAAATTVAAALAILSLPHRGADRVVPPAIAILALFVATYAAFLVVSLSFFDANTPLDDRILLPVFVAGLIVALNLLDRMWPAARTRPAARPILATLVLVFVTGHVVKGFEGARESYAKGWGFTSLAWQESPILANVRVLPENVLIYSNAPEIIYLHTGRPSTRLPRRYFLMTQRTNPDWPSQILDVERDLRARCGVVVYVRRLKQKSMATEQELEAQLRLQVVSETPDGVVFTTGNCGT